MKVLLKITNCFYICIKLYDLKNMTNFAKNVYFFM